MGHPTIIRLSGRVLAAVIFLSLLMTTGQALARESALKQLLTKNKISLNLVRLERADGFRFGLLFNGPERSVLIAPGAARMLLVQVDGNEVIYQADRTGTFQVIQADIAEVELEDVLCIASVVIGFFQNLLTCTEGDYTCYLTAVITLFSDLASCNVGVTP